MNGDASHSSGLGGLIVALVIGFAVIVPMLVAWCSQ